jgi:hypothetical protein
MTDNKTSYNNTNYTPVKPQRVMVDNKPVTTIRNILLSNLSFIVNYHCLRFDRGIIRIVVTGCIVNHDYLRFDRGIVRIVVTGFTFKHDC